MPFGRSSLTIQLALLYGCAVASPDEVTPLRPALERGAAEADESAESEPEPEPAPPAPGSGGGPIASWSFEPASADCNGWTVRGARGIRAAPPHSGAYACKLCADGEAETMSLSRRLSALEAGRYRVTAWVRRLRASDVPVTARIALDRGSSSTAETADVPLHESWRALSDPLDLAAGVASAQVSISAIAGAPAQCILVDDVVVERTHDVTSYR